MNELATLSDAELDKAIADIKERDLAVQTEAGLKHVRGKMRECIGWLESVGYRFDGDQLALAKLWTVALKEEFVLLGEVRFKNAVMYYASHDDREYKSFPQIPWIAEACRHVGGDPRVEKGRRVQTEAEQRMEREHEEEVNRFKEEHPDLYARAIARAERLRKENMNDSDILGRII